MTVKHLTVNKAIEEGITFALEIEEVGAAFIGTMVAKGTEKHGINYQAKSAEELREDFECFKSGVLKLKKLIAEGYEKCVPREKCLSLKEYRIVSGVHPVILSERLGISTTYLERLENGEAKQSLTWDQAMIHYQSTYLLGMKMDFINWSLKQK